MLPLAKYQIHLDQLERYDHDPLDISCEGLHPRGGYPVEVLRIAGICSIFGAPEHMRRIRDCINSRLTQIEAEAIAAELRRQDEYDEATIDRRLADVMA